MERSEIIPQTSQDLGSGHLFYHFSLMANDTNPPNPKFEHQIAFFEVGSSYYTDGIKLTRSRVISRSSSTVF